jgi:hypothetical protein
MTLANYCLVLGGVASLLIALLHVVLALRPQTYSYFGAAELAELAGQGSPFVLLVSLGLALMFAAWGAYAFSGAGVLRRLPLLQVVLIAAGVIYVLRSLMLPSELIQVFKSDLGFRFLIFSGGSLVIGVLYLLGALARQGG